MIATRVDADATPANPDGRAARGRLRGAGIRLPCPRCGAIGSADEANGLVLWFGDASFRCESCCEDITRKDVENLRRMADVVLAMLDIAATA